MMSKDQAISIAHDAPDAARADKELREAFSLLVGACAATDDELALANWIWLRIIEPRPIC